MNYGHMLALFISPISTLVQAFIQGCQKGGGGGLGRGAKDYAQGSEVKTSRRPPATKNKRRSQTTTGDQNRRIPSQF